MGAELVRVLNEVLGTGLSAGSLGVSIWAVQVARGRDFLRRLKEHAVVTAVTATTDGRDLIRSAVAPIELTAGDQAEVTCDTNFDPGAGARMRVTWTDESGQESSEERYQNPRRRR